VQDGDKYKLTGRTLQVYLYLQRKKEPSGIRAVQRDLGLSSPSVADYQIEKLVGMGLAAKDSYGRVSITKKVRVKELDSYVTFGRFSVPRLAFYASVFSAVAVMYAVFNLDGMSVYGVAVPAAAAAVLWLEAWKMWKFSLIERAQNGGPGEKQVLLRMLLPGVAAAVVLAGAGVFLSQYSQQGFLVPAPVAPYDWAQGRLTLDESVEMSHQRAVEVGTNLVSGPTLTALAVAGAGAAGFTVLVIARYRRVLVPEHLTETASGTQDYPERMR
jgi:hypothetical protein